MPPRTPTLPPGITAEELRAALREAGFARGVVDHFLDEADDNPRRAVELMRKAKVDASALNRAVAALPSEPLGLGPEELSRLWGTGIDAGAAQRALKGADTAEEYLANLRREGVSERQIDQLVWQARRRAEPGGQPGPAAERPRSPEGGGFRGRGATGTWQDEAPRPGPPDEAPRPGAPAREMWGRASQDVVGSQQLTGDDLLAQALAAAGGTVAGSFIFGGAEIEPATPVPLRREERTVEVVAGVPVRRPTTVTDTAADVMKDLAALPEAELRRYQESLFVGGYFGNQPLRDVNFGSFDAMTRAAFGAAIADTLARKEAGQDVTLDEVVDQMRQRGVDAGRAITAGGDVRITLADPVGLTEALNATARKILRRNEDLPVETQRLFVAMIHQLQREAGTVERGEATPPDVEGRLLDFLRQRFPQEVRRVESVDELASGRENLLANLVSLDRHMGV